MKLEKLLDGISSILGTLGFFLILLGLILLLAVASSDVVPSSGHVFIAFFLGLTGGISIALGVVSGQFSEDSKEETNKQKVEDPTKTV